MTAQEIRHHFLEFFRSRQHQIVPSAPIVVKNDPTLMFTNAGMNQFKDYFLGNKPAPHSRIADTQKCLRVSGKHNDLEEVGIDTYHHTMFEMLGNWSFGDPSDPARGYFKKEAIRWAWELLTGVYKIDPSRMYVTIFEGDPKEQLERDNESYDIWKECLPEDRILNGNKKDNFWEMGDTGPCGPCSEIHCDLRPDAARQKTDGKLLVNTGDPQVIEIWNLVFIQFNRKADGSLELLPAKHVDTGMGFERLTRVLQAKSSNYDTDLFQPLIRHLEQRTGIRYGSAESTDIAMRVMSDHIRAISFAVADGQLPSSNGAGYVIRRILRRAVRYAYSYLQVTHPLFNELVPVLADQMKDIFPELAAQQDFVQKVILEEENSFLKTLDAGLRKLKQLEGHPGFKQTIEGPVAFELYDTYGFPFDLTQRIAREKGWTVDEKGFETEMLQQKTRSRHAASSETSDWVTVQEGPETAFLGYDELSLSARILKYRSIRTKDKTQVQVVLDKTPFYAESGGQVGDTGWLESNTEKVQVLDTKKENDLILHIVNKLPSNPEEPVVAVVDIRRRADSMNNHSATHLLHAALRKVLGTHVQQKGSLVNPEYLRFDFSHFQKMTHEELAQVEQLVNEKIRQDIPLQEQRQVPFEQAAATGAMALFGEKYGAFVRVITFDKNYSVELCGGTHVSSTGHIGFFKIIAESAVAAGVRRIEALTGRGAEAFVAKAFDEMEQVNSLVKHPKGMVEGLRHVLKEKALLEEKVQQLQESRVTDLRKTLELQAEPLGAVRFLAQTVMLDQVDLLKSLAAQLIARQDDLFVVLASSQSAGQVSFCIGASQALVEAGTVLPGEVVKVIAPLLHGKGGGKGNVVAGGGTNPGGIHEAFAAAKKLLG